MITTPKPAELLLVDYRPQEDLMFWDQLARGLAEAEKEGRYICVVVGSGENLERLLLQKGYSSERSPLGELHLPDELTEEAEILLREEKRRISARLTDEGVSAVGILGFERGLVRTRNEDIILSGRAQSRLWQAPGVVPVLMSIGRTEHGALRDLHPVRLGDALAASLSDSTSVFVLSQRLASKPQIALSHSDTAHIGQLIVEGLLPGHAAQKKNWANWTIIAPSDIGANG